MRLDLQAKNIEFYYDELDSNAINFILENGYFSISTSVYLEEDDQLNEPYFEFNSQDHSQFGGLQRVIFHHDNVTLAFENQKLFLGKHETVKINFNGIQPIKKITDFFVNHLFFGELTEYENGFDPNNVVSQTRSRDLL